MKRCPVCNATFDDPYLSFCPNDGTPLLRMSADEAHTVLMSTARETDPATAPASNLPPPPQPYGWANDSPAQWTPPPPPAIRGPATQQQSLAVASLILGLISITFGWICGGPFFALFALVLGIVALFQIKKDPVRYGGKPMALIGSILGAVVLAIYIVFVAIWIIMMFAGAVSR
ncbi:MAG TPA: DUF4190 domain-containing protein [Pyrinomonadaceae bacterium]|nr:DUF4190 domain-containing protein [Pyrinomonadaceae bacterium]